MKVTYQPTFDQFADNYLSTYYSGGVRVLQRAAGGPLLIIAGALIMIWTNERVEFWLLRYPLLLAGLVVSLYGLGFTLKPLFSLFLVWLRRQELFESKNATTTLEIKADLLLVTQQGETLTLPLDQILTIQHRSVSTWILTRSDNLVYVPRTGLIEGDHDAFVSTLIEKTTPKETED